MTPKDVALFQAELSGANSPPGVDPPRSYFEFGMGGSTGLASRTTNLRLVTAVDSDDAFVAAMRDAKLGEHVRLLWANIGPVRDWGNPVEKHAKECTALYRNYAASYASVRASTPTDIVFVDGRFRVSCVAEVLATGDRPRVFIVHDYLDRMHQFGDIELLLDRVRCGDVLCVFRVKPDLDPNVLAEVRAKHAVDFH